MFKSTTNNSKQFSPPSHHMQATIIQILFIMLLSLVHNDHDITVLATSCSVKLFQIKLKKESYCGGVMVALMVMVVVVMILSLSRFCSGCCWID